MAPHDRRQLARESYLAFARGDRSFFEKHLRADFRFSNPPHPLLDRDGWFQRCWPAAGHGKQFEFLRVLEVGNEVIVTYELRAPGRPPSRNTEILTFDGDALVRTVVHLRWMVE